MLRRSLPTVLAVLGLAGCAGTRSAADLPSGWRQLTEPPPAFAALYRLECCARRNLLLTVRCAGGVADVAVTAPPGATLVRAWVTEDGAWMWDGEAQCVRRLPGAGLPLGEGRALPLRPLALALVLSGGVPGGATPVPGSRDLVMAMVAGERWTARLAGPVPRVVAVEVAGADGRPVLEARVTRHRLGRIPAAVELRVGEERFGLNLVSWRRAELVTAPSWLSGARCGDGA